MSAPLTSNQVPTKPAVRRVWVKLQLAERGRNLSDLARDHKLTRQAIYDAFNRPSARVEEIIASAIGMSVQDLFPERFSADGHRLSKSSTAHRAGHVRRRSAA